VLLQSWLLGRLRKEDPLSPRVQDQPGQHSKTLFQKETRKEKERIKEKGKRKELGVGNSHL
jgi:hypothetical protein